MPTPDIRLVPKSDDETARWLPVAMAAYEHARIDAGDTSEQAVVARRASEEQFFPDGRLIDGHFLFTVVAEGEDAGWLWIGPSNDAATWWVWDIEARGHATADAPAASVRQGHHLDAVPGAREHEHASAGHAGERAGESRGIRTCTRLVR